MAFDLCSNVTELKHLLKQVFLLSQIGGPEKIVTEAEVKAVSERNITHELHYVTLNNLSWEQDNERVKVKKFKHFLPLYRVSKEAHSKHSFCHCFINRSLYNLNKTFVTSL